MRKIPYKPYNIFVRNVISLVSLLYIVFVSVNPALSVLPARFVKREVSTKKCPHYGPSEDCDRIGTHQLPDERHRAVLQHPDDILSHEIQILLSHVRHLILHFSGVVNDDESALLLLRLYVELVVFVDAVELLQESFVGGARKTENIPLGNSSLENRSILTCIGRLKDRANRSVCPLSTGDTLYCP
jgi:hypothetical protein